jgi:hypothetical protein
MERILALYLYNLFDYDNVFQHILRVPHASLEFFFLHSIPHAPLLMRPLEPMNCFLAD